MRKCLTHASHIVSHKGRLGASHLTRKDGIYYYRRRLPEHLGTDVALSLGTRRFREAEHLAEHPDTAADPDPSRLLYQAAMLRAHRNGVSHTDFLARVVAPYLADERGEEARPLFASDDHFRHQAARLFFLPRPFGSQRKLWAKRKRGRQAPREYGRLSWRTRVYTFRRLTDTLGVFALGASNAIRR